MVTILSDGNAISDDLRLRFGNVADAMSFP